MRKILYIFTSKSQDDRCAWSGTMYNTYRELVRAGFDVDYLCATRDNKPSLIDKILWEYWKRVPKCLGKQVRCDESFFSVYVFSQTLKHFDYTPYDIIFVPTHIAIVNALPKNIKAKIVHLVDATVDSLFNYYTEFSNLLWHNYLEAHILGKRAFQRADLIIASSDWCKQNSIKDYAINSNKIVVVEFGANIDDKDIPAIPKSIDAKRHLNIYWSGVNWERKGGNIALDCCEELIRSGHDITLHITGIKKEDPITSYIESKPFVQNHGFLNKNIPEQYQQLVSLMSEMDIFLFPSKAECSSIALCEANGFGLPCFVYDTGGTGNYVLNGINGYMLPLISQGNDFANCIDSCIKESKLNKLSEGAVERYKTHLNWNVWSQKVKDTISLV